MSKSSDPLSLARPPHQNATTTTAAGGDVASQQEPERQQQQQGPRFNAVNLNSIFKTVVGNGKATSYAASARQGSSSVRQAGGRTPGIAALAHHNHHHAGGSHATLSNHHGSSTAFGATFAGGATSGPASGAGDPGSCGPGGVGGVSQGHVSGTGPSGGYNQRARLQSSTVATPKPINLPSLRREKVRTAAFLNSNPVAASGRGAVGSGGTAIWGSIPKPAKASDVFLVDHQSGTSPPVPQSVSGLARGSSLDLASQTPRLQTQHTGQPTRAWQPSPKPLPSAAANPVVSSAPTSGIPTGPLSAPCSQKDPPQATTDHLNTTAPHSSVDNASKLGIPATTKSVTIASSTEYLDLDTGWADDDEDLDFKTVPFPGPSSSEAPPSFQLSAEDTSPVPPPYTNPPPMQPSRPSFTFQPVSSRRRDPYNANHQAVHPVASRSCDTSRVDAARQHYSTSYQRPRRSGWDDEFPPNPRTHQQQRQNQPHLPLSGENGRMSVDAGYGRGLQRETSPDPALKGFQRGSPPMRHAPDTLGRRSLARSGPSLGSGVSSPPSNHSESQFRRSPSLTSPREPQNTLLKPSSNFGDSNTSIDRLDSASSAMVLSADEVAKRQELMHEANERARKRKQEEEQQEREETDRRIREKLRSLDLKTGVAVRDSAALSENEEACRQSGSHEAMSIEGTTLKEQPISPEEQTRCSLAKPSWSGSRNPGAHQPSKPRNGPTSGKSEEPETFGVASSTKLSDTAQCEKGRLDSNYTLQRHSPESVVQPESGTTNLHPSVTRFDAVMERLKVMMGENRMAFVAAEKQKLKSPQERPGKSSLCSNTTPGTPEPTAVAQQTAPKEPPTTSMPADPYNDKQEETGGAGGTRKKMPDAEDHNNQEYVKRQLKGVLRPKTSCESSGERPMRNQARKASSPGPAGRRNDKERGKRVRDKDNGKQRDSREQSPRENRGRQTSSRSSVWGPVSGRKAPAEDSRGGNESSGSSSPASVVVAAKHSTSLGPRSPPWKYGALIDQDTSAATRANITPTTVVATATNGKRHKSRKAPRIEAVSRTKCHKIGKVLPEKVFVPVPEHVIEGARGKSGFIQFGTTERESEDNTRSASLETVSRPSGKPHSRTKARVAPGKSALANGSNRHRQRSEEFGAAKADSPRPATPFAEQDSAISGSRPQISATYGAGTTLWGSSSVALTALNMSPPSPEVLSKENVSSVWKRDLGESGKAPALNSYRELMDESGDDTEDQEVMLGVRKIVEGVIGLDEDDIGTAGGLGAMVEPDSHPKLGSRSPLAAPPNVTVSNSGTVVSQAPDMDRTSSHGHHHHPNPPNRPRFRDRAPRSSQVYHGRHPQDQQGITGSHQRHRHSNHPLHGQAFNPSKFGSKAPHSGTGPRTYGLPQVGGMFNGHHSQALSLDPNSDAADSHNPIAAASAPTSTPVPAQSSGHISIPVFTNSPSLIPVSSSGAYHTHNGIHAGHAPPPPTYQYVFTHFSSPTLGTYPGTARGAALGPPLPSPQYGRPEHQGQVPMAQMGGPYPPFTPTWYAAPAHPPMPRHPHHHHLPHGQQHPLRLPVEGQGFIHMAAAPYGLGSAPGASTPGCVAKGMDTAEAENATASESKSAAISPDVNSPENKCDPCLA